MKYNKNKKRLYMYYMVRDDGKPFRIFESIVDKYRFVIGCFECGEPKVYSKHYSIRRLKYVYNETVKEHPHAKIYRCLIEGD